MTGQNILCVSVCKGAEGNCREELTRLNIRNTMYYGGFICGCWLGIDKYTEVVLYGPRVLLLHMRDMLQKTTSYARASQLAF
jgi:hypothetical protein